ncbi:MAG: hypothetical protein ACPGXL_08565 [Chitinophagales bacterium]
MNKFKIIALLMLTISTLTYGQAPNNMIDTTTIAPKWGNLAGQGFTIQYPTDWDIDISRAMNTNFILFSPIDSPQDPFRENVNLIIQDLSDYDFTLEQYAVLSTEQIKTMITDGKIIVNEQKGVGEKAYQKVIYSGKQGMFDLQFEQYYWVINKKAYVLTLTCTIDQFDNYQEIGEAIMDSFEIK